MDNNSDDLNEAAALREHWPFTINTRAELIRWLDVVSAQSLDQTLDPLERFRADVQRKIISGLIQEINPAAMFQHSLQNKLLAQLTSTVKRHIRRVPDQQLTQESRDERDQLVSFMLTEATLLYVAIEIASRNETSECDDLFALVDIMRERLFPQRTAN